MTKIKKYKNGEVYKGEIKNNMRHGFGELQYPDGRKYEGNWDNDMMHGYGTYDFGDGRHFEGHFSSDLQHGFGVFVEPQTRSEVWGGFFQGALHTTRAIKWILSKEDPQHISESILVGDLWFSNELVDGLRIDFGGNQMIPGQPIPARQYPRITRIFNDSSIEYVPISEILNRDEQIARLNKKIKKKQSEYEVSKAKIDSLEKEVSVWRDQSAASQDSASHNQRALIAEIQHLRQQLLEKEKSYDEFRREQRDLEKQITEQLEEQQLLLDELEQVHAQRQKELAARITQLESVVEDKDSAIDEIRRELASTTEQLSASSAAAALASATSTTATVAPAVQEEVIEDEIIEETEEGQKSSGVALSAEDIEKLKQELDQANSKLTENQSTIDELRKSLLQRDREVEEMRAKSRVAAAAAAAAAAATAPSAVSSSSLTSSSSSSRSNRSMSVMRSVSSSSLDVKKPVAASASVASPATAVASEQNVPTDFRSVLKKTGVSIEELERKRSMKSAQEEIVDFRSVLRHKKKTDVIDVEGGPAEQQKSLSSSSNVEVAHASLTPRSTSFVDSGVNGGSR